MTMLQDAGARIGLTNLDLRDTERLLGSVFGDTPNVRLLADRLHGVSQGSPSVVMQLAQHLVDKGAIHYQAGAWSLPDRVDVGDLPRSMTEALEAKAEKLNADARTLAQTLALTPEQSFDLDECSVLAGKRDKAALLQSLNELVAFGIISTDGQYYCLGQQGWVSALTRGLNKESERAFHLNIAEVFSLRGSNDFRVAMHLFAAGQEQRGLDRLIHDAEHSQKNLVQNTDSFYEYMHSLPADWVDTYKLALTLCQKLNRPRRQAFLLRMSLIRFSILTGLEDVGLVHEVIEQLFQDSGLGFYRDLDDSMDAEARLWRALELAQRHYDATPELQRVFAPGEAIPELASAMSYVMGTASNAYDHSIVADMPSLEPLVPLSPALGVVNRVLNAGRAMLSARHEQARQEIQGILRTIAQPDRGGLTETIHRITRFSWTFALGMLEATFGIKSSLRSADEVEQDLLHQVNAWRIRMVYYLRQGDADQAEHCKRQVELLRIQNAPTQHFGGVCYFPELVAHGLAEDLVRVKGTIEDIEKAAKRFRTWVPILHFARGEYQRVRGDYASALSEFEQALSLVAPGRHVVWPNAAGAQLQTLFELDRCSEAKEIGQKSLLEAEKRDMSYGSTYIQMPLALIQAKLGEHEAAVRNAEAAIAKYRAVGTTGLGLGIAYEVRAHVALLMRDRDAFADYAQLCAEEYQTGRNPALTAKYEKLFQQARRSKLGVSDGLAHAADYGEYGEDSTASLVTTALTGCAGPQDRLKRALELLVEQSNSAGGFLYAMHTGGPQLCAQNGSAQPPAEMDAIVRRFVQAELEDSGDITMTVADLGAGSAGQFDWSNERGEEYCPLLLAHDTDDGFCIAGVAVLLPDPGKRFVQPVETAAQLSRALSKAGDVTPVLTDD